MCDILITATTVDLLQQVAKQVSYEIETRDLIIAPETIQESSPWKYLGHIVTTPQV
jgi:hypothetical protein